MDSVDELPSDFWKASLVFLVFGSAVAGICVFMALLAFCVQKIGKKPLISVVGIIQAIAGKFLRWPFSDKLRGGDEGDREMGRGEVKEESL